MSRKKIHENRDARHRAYMKRLKETDPERVKKYSRESGRRYRENHPEYLQIRAEKYRKRRIAAIKQFGGKCSCGFMYDGKNAAAFHFHHRDPVSKGKRSLASLFISGSEEALQKELSKCSLLCSNCHEILHGGEF